MIAKIDHDSTPEIAVVVPAHNEAESIASLTDEIASTFIGKSTAPLGKSTPSVSVSLGKPVI